MNGAELINLEQWSLSSLVGYSHPFLVANIEIVIHTWIILLLLLCVLLGVRLLLSRVTIIRYFVIQLVAFFMDLTEQSLGYFNFNHCVFAASLFIFIALCNTAPLIPWLEEPTRDLNTALALGLISFLYVQSVSIRAKGVRSYFGEFLKPFFLLMPLNIISKLSSIVSISFRLFGNIFGGSIITKLYFAGIQSSVLFQLMGIFSGFNFLMVVFFILFEGTLQAFVFAMLTLTYLSIGTQEGSH